MATCRHKGASGHFTGAIQRQVEILQEAQKAGAALVDLEIESVEACRSAGAALRANGPLCISYHNFEKTPPLESILRRLRKEQAEVYKIATTARKPSDNLRLWTFAREHKDLSMILLAMAETGMASRVLASASGSLFTYAAPAGEQGTAPGQVSAKLLRTLYRCDKLTRQSRVYGVIANPVAHSKSPLIHNRAFHARRIDAVYLPFLVAPLQLADWMKFAAEMPIAGFSVTIPHKQRIMKFLDHVDPLAKRIGAVNTVWRKGGKWRGDNTDAAGVMKPLSRLLRIARSSVLIAGYGGAARAAAIALADGSAKVTVTGRNLAKAHALAKVVKGEAVSLKEAAARRFDALIHATPLGMHPNSDACLFPDAIPAGIVFDMVYNPHQTKLLQHAEEQGLTVVHGIDMLLEQAARQFEIWTGENAPRSIMRDAIELR